MMSSRPFLPLLLFLHALLCAQQTQATFNYEVERRVFERVDDFMSGPRIVTSLLERFRKNGAFPHELNVTDRDSYATLSYSLLNEYKFDMMYYGTEDGIFVGYNEEVWGTYREPGNSGYNPQTQVDMLKYYKACVNRETGEAEDCVMSADAQYIRCRNNCALELCGDEVTQACHDDSIACTKQQKWCPQYDIVTATNDTAPMLGYVPRTQHCHTIQGVFSQQPGAIVQADGTLGNCLYEDKETLVNRNLAGDYVYCGGNGAICDNVFVGGFRSRDYDPRYREWYTATKKLQKPNWTPPYPFFTNLDLGITFSAPFYVEDDNRRQIFRGVFAVDYTFEDITRFLVDSYGSSTSDGSSNETGEGNNSDNDQKRVHMHGNAVHLHDSNVKNSEETYVVIYEAAEPNYLVATSTGRSAASKVLESDETVPCPDDADDNAGCIVKRVTMDDIEGKPFDEVLRESYTQQKRLGYPRELVSAKLSDETGAAAYVSQSSFYASGDDLEWIILVISPVQKSETDSLTKGDALFGVVCVIASLGFLLCLAMFFSFLYKRKSRAVILADWRFTSAFLMGCALLNLSSFTFLGENTDALCLVRMWSFHFLFALALSPLFVKVYRMWRLVGTPNRNPSIISNPKAVALTLPIILIQVSILTVFTIVDPPRAEDIIMVQDTVATQQTECVTNTEAFTFTVFGFECGLILIGCVLAFITRNLDSGFGQSKELMFSMYNIAFIGLVIAVISFSMDIDMTGSIVLFAMGIFCGTVFSSAAFVLPRLIQTQQEQQVLPHRSSNNKKTDNGSKTNPKKKSRVNFSEDVGHELDTKDSDGRDRPVTGWSAVEEEDAATGLKRASSINSIPEDDVWTELQGSVDSGRRFGGNGSVDSGRRFGGDGSIESGRRSGGGRSSTNGRRGGSNKSLDSGKRRGSNGSIDSGKLYQDTTEETARDDTWRSSDDDPPAGQSTEQSPPSDRRQHYQKVEASPSVLTSLSV